MKNKNTKNTNYYNKINLGGINYEKNIKKSYNRNLYKRIEKENKNILYFKDNLLIANEIYLDYVTDSEDYDDQYITYADIENEEKWWEDYDFLTK